MSSLNFTDRAIASLKGARALVEYWDEKTPGFGMRVSPGGKKTWFVMYRIAGVRRRLRLGHYPVINLEVARKNARAVLQRVSDGIDPAQEKKNQLVAMEQKRRDARTFDQLAQEYLEQHAKRFNREKTWKEYERIIDKVLSPAFGKYDVKQLASSQIRALLRSIAQNHSVMANRTRAVLGAIFKWAIQEEIIQENPVASITRPGGAEKPKERSLSEEELRIFWNAKTSPSTPVLQMILLTGQRPGEVMGMQWQELDLESALWELPGDRTKNGKSHVVPLNTMAKMILQQQRESLDTQRKKRAKRGDPDTGSPFVFPSRHLKKQATAPVRMLRKAIKRIVEETGMMAFAPHDLRRTCATCLGKMEVPGHIIDRILNHTLKGETDRVYNRYNYLKEQREAFDNWGEVLSGIVNNT
jgi:integrase